MLSDYTRHFEEVYNKGEQDGIELGILKTKVHIVAWILDKGAYKSANDLARYILSLKMRDIVNESSLALDETSISLPPVMPFESSDYVNKGENTYSKTENKIPDL